MKITFIIGTRPELIKVAPVILECQRQKIEIDIVNTAQHKDLLDPYWKTFNIWPSKVLDVMISFIFANIPKSAATFCLDH